MSAASNQPDPTEHEGRPEVADARHDVMEWLGNCSPVYDVGVLLSEVSPLALGIFVVSCLHGLGDDAFTEVEIATARGEVAHDSRARKIMEGVLGENEAVQEAMSYLAPDVPEEDRGARSVLLMGPYATDATTQSREWMANRVERADLLAVDWHKLADDMNDEPPAWKSYTEDHDGRGCYDCLGGHCLVGLEDAQPEPDREAVEREAAFRLKASTMD